MEFLTEIEINDVMWLIVSLLDLYAILSAVTRGQVVERTLAWVFAILAFPAIGAIFYILLATPSVKKTTKRKRMSAKTISELVRTRANLPCSEAGQAEESILNLATSLTGFPPSQGNIVLLLAEDKFAFQKIEESLKNAQRSIWAEYYIIRRDETGKRFLDILTEKAREGIEVKLLYDALGSMRIDADRLNKLKKAGGEVEAFLPLNPLRRRWSVHLRNHRKMIIVDGEIGYTGGMNIGDEYSGRARKKGMLVFHDTHLELRGPAVGDLARIFAEDWSFATDKQIEPPHPPLPLEGANSVVAVVPSGPDQDVNANAMVYFSGITIARQRVLLTSPYFVPDEPTLQALISSAMRGVDVKILVPAISDVRLMRLAARSYYRDLLMAGVRIFEYQPSMLHAKTMVVDGRWCIVGSANVDIRSFRLNFEVGALIFDSNFAKELEKRFYLDLAKSHEVTLSNLLRDNYLHKLSMGAVRLLSPLL